MARKPKHTTPADFSLLDFEDKNRLRLEAASQVQKERKAAAEEAYLAGLLLDERREKGVDEPLETGVLDLSEWADRIVINGEPFLHGVQYTLPASVWGVLRECAQRGWQHHYESKEGKSKLAQRPRAVVMNQHGAVNTSAFMRA